MPPPSPRYNTPVEREGILQLPSLMQIHHRNRVVLLHSEMVGQSAVLRKMSNEGGELYTDDDSIFHACLLASTLPSSPSDLEKWLSAYDFLCGVPSPEIFFAALSRGFRSILRDNRSLLECAKQVYPSYRPLHERICERRCVAESFDAGGHEPQQASGPKPSSPPIAGDDTAVDRAYNAPLALSTNHSRTHE